MNIKGILMAGGKGTRLAPLTKIINKHLLPIYNKPMIYYSLSILMMMNIREILIITRPEEKKLYQKLLKSGKEFGVKLKYISQKKPNGIAQSFLLGKKFIGSDNKGATILAKNHYDEIDLKYEIFESSKATELAKVLSTTYYGMCIAFHNDINNLCKEHNVKFDEVATKWNKTYNEGYSKLGMSNVIRPVLYPPKDGKIGGHCVVPNAELCKQFFDSKVLDYILELK